MTDRATRTGSGGAAAFLALVLVLALAACAPVARYHGYVPTDADLDAIVVGRDTRDSVAQKVGRPGVGGVMEGSGWYYVQSDWVDRGWRAPVEVDRQVVAISFDRRGVVSNIERFGLQDGEVITLSRRVTDSGPTGRTVLQQVFGVFGRFSPAGIIGG